MARATQPLAGLQWAQQEHCNVLAVSRHRPLLQAGAVLADSSTHRWTLRVSNRCEGHLYAPASAARAQLHGNICVPVAVIDGVRQNAERAAESKRGDHCVLVSSNAAPVRIRNATAAEALVLEALQRRSSDIWEAHREQLAANPDAIQLPQRFIDSGWVRVAVAGDGTPIGFSVVIPAGEELHELDGLFVEPAYIHHGIGRCLIEDATARASTKGAARMEVTAGSAQGFYEKVGFTVVAKDTTRFGPAVRMRRELQGEAPARGRCAGS